MHWGSIREWATGCLLLNKIIVSDVKKTTQPNSRPYYYYVCCFRRCCQQLRVIFFIHIKKEELNEAVVEQTGNIHGFLLYCCTGWAAGQALIEPTCSGLHARSTTPLSIFRNSKSKTFESLGRREQGYKRLIAYVFLKQDHQIDWDAINISISKTYFQTVLLRGDIKNVVNA